MIYIEKNCSEKANNSGSWCKEATALSPANSVLFLRLLSDDGRKREKEIKMARHRTCFIVLTMMLVCLLQGSAAHAVRHGFPPDILHVDYDESAAARPFVINRFGEEADDGAGEHIFNRLKRSPGVSGSGSGSTTSSLPTTGASGKDGKNSVPPVIEAKVSQCADGFFLFGFYVHLF